MLKKNIIVYTENYEYGGLEKFLVDLISNTNANILLFFNQENERIRLFARRNHLKYKMLKIKSNQHMPRFKNGILNTIIVALYLAKEYFDLVLNYRYLSKLFQSQGSYENLLIISGGYPGANSGRIAAIAAKKMAIKNVIFSVLSNPLPKKYATPFPFLTSVLDLISNVINHIIDNRVINSVDTFHVNCNAIKTNMVSSRIFPSRKIKTVYTGIYVPQPREITKISQIKNDFITLIKNPMENWVGMTGLLYQAKGQEYLIRAIKIVIDAGYQNLKCLIVGDGPDYAKLLQLSKTFSVEQNIILTGKYPYEVGEIYRLLDIFIFTSLHEGLPYVISEAMAYKLPIISTNVGGIPEQIEEGINGCLVEKANPQALANKIIWMLKNQDKWIDMGEASYKRVKEHFSINAMIRGIENLMQ